VVDDVGDLVGVEAEVEGMEDPAGERDAEVGLEVGAVVPGERGDAVAGPDAEAGEGLREAARAAREVAVCAALDGFIGGAPDDGAAEILGVSRRTVYYRLCPSITPRSRDVGQRRP